MAELLPRLRMDLDFMPSPVEDRPGLLIRDPFGYSDSALIIPPVLVECLQFFNGQSTELDLRSALVRITGDLRISPVVEQLTKALGEAGFVENDVYTRMRERRHSAFAEASVRTAAHAGSAYPRDAAGLTATLERYLNSSAGAPRPALRGIAAPHVSPDGGAQMYRAAYSVLGPEYKDRTFAILGTSHYGLPERFGLTRKPFTTPLGRALTDTALVDWLEREGGPAVTMEDYCHAVEHSIEFQVVFLQHLFGPDVRILPVLCGPFAASVQRGGRPEDDEGVRRFLGALGELAAREGDRLLWVLGVDMAHIGRRYGDPYAVRANAGRMQEVEAADRRRIQSLLKGEESEFWSAVQENADDLKWCGSAPFYAFLKAAPGSQGQLLGYEQWNIDPQSVVSFGAIAFGA